MSATGRGGSGEGRQTLRPLHWRVLALIFALYLVDGIDGQLLPVTIARLAKEWSLPPSAFGVAMAAGHAGAALGAILCGTLADRFGRRPLILGGTVLFGVMTFAMAWARSPAQLEWLRLVAGIGLGGCMPPGLALLAETMPSRLRASVLSLALLCWPLGIGCAGLLAALVLDSSGWPALFLAAAALTGVVALAIAIFLPESPSYLVRVPSRRTKCEEICARLGIEPASIAQAPAKARTSDMLLLFRHSAWGATLAITTVYFLVYFGMTMVLAWLPALMARAGFASAITGSALSVWSFAGMGGIALVSAVATRLPAERMVIYAMASAIVALTIIAAVFPANAQEGLSPVFFLLIGCGGFAMNATMSAIYAWAAPTFAPQVRGSGMGFAITFGRLGAILGSFAGVMVMERTGVGGFFLLTGGIIVAAALVFAIGQGLVRAIGPAAGTGEAM